MSPLVKDVQLGWEPQCCLFGQLKFKQSSPSSSLTAEYYFSKNVVFCYRIPPGPLLVWTGGWILAGSLSSLSPAPTCTLISRWASLRWRWSCLRAIHFARFHKMHWATDLLGVVVLLLLPILLACLAKPGRVGTWVRSIKLSLICGIGGAIIICYAKTLSNWVRPPPFEKYSFMIAPLIAWVGVPPKP